MTHNMRSFVSWHQLSIFLLGLLMTLVAYPAAAQQESKVLRSGWYQWDPYQYEIAKDDLKHLTGLDIQLLKAVFGKMGVELQIDPVGWRQHQLDVKEGYRDIAGGAFRSKEREAYAYYSIPYRSEKDMLYVRRDEQKKFKFTLQMSSSKFLNPARISSVS